LQGNPARRLLGRILLRPLCGFLLLGSLFLFVGLVLVLLCRLALFGSLVLVGIGGAIRLGLFRSGRDFFLRSRNRPWPVLRQLGGACEGKDGSNKRYARNGSDRTCLPLKSRIETPWNRFGCRDSACKCKSPPSGGLSQVLRSIRTSS
jgi:hypothetical protein